MDRKADCERRCVRGNLMKDTESGGYPHGLFLLFYGFSCLLHSMLWDAQMQERQDKFLLLLLDLTERRSLGKNANHKLQAVNAPIGYLWRVKARDGNQFQKLSRTNVV